jgi:two-component system, cell cycle response regulator
MARLRQQTTATGHKVLIVDDDLTLLQTLEQLLSHEGHQVFAASSGEAAINLCETEQPHLILLDYFMPGMTGEDVVRAVRRFNSEVQIVLQTGYASERPARTMLRELDIQGYHDKSEGPEKLLVWVDVALKSFRHSRALKASRDGLNFILRATPDLHRLQPLEDLMRGILTQIYGLLGLAGAFVATVPVATVPVAHETPNVPPTPKSQPLNPAPDQSAFVAALEPDPSATLEEPLETMNFAVQVGIGRYENMRWETLDPTIRDVVMAAVKSGHTQRGRVLAIPLKSAETTIGIIFVEQALEPSADLGLLEIFANQAAIAIENVRLYELATVDDLTRLATRRHWFNRFDDSLRQALRYGQPLGLLMLDIDHFKAINDRYGHLAGNMVLTTLGQVLNQRVRSADIVGRFGGEEFAIVLPQTDQQGATIVAEALRQAVSQSHATYDGIGLKYHVSIGVSSLLASESDASNNSQQGRGQVEGIRDRMLENADKALYAAKAQGRNCVAVAEPMLAASLLPNTLLADTLPK